MKANGTEIASLLPAIILLSLMALAPAANADSERGDGHGKRFGMERGPMISARMLGRLDLDDTQRQTVDNIFEAAKPEFDALREHKRANRASLAALDPASDSYSIDLEAIAAENGRLASEATLLFSRVHNDVNAVLTEDQRAKLEQGMERRKERGKNRKRDHERRVSES